MYQYTNIFVTSCETCQKVKCDTRPAKAPLIPMLIPEKPMDFISIDIAHMPKDNDGYQYVLLIGDMFSKFIQAVPMRDQTAPTVIKSFSNNWLYVHGMPSYLLSDQGSNVDGDTVRTFCNALDIEKRRSTPYHSQGNGFAERNIRSMRDMLRAVLSHRNLNQGKWRQLLPGLVFALNCSKSKATKCIPYQVVFGRKPQLPVDKLFNTQIKNNIDDVVKPSDYVDEIDLTLKDLFHFVIEHLQLSKIEMMKQDNKNIRFHNYADGDNVWLKIKHFKTGESRKLSPRRNGPWIVIKKLPNGVNFEIRNKHTSETKIVHHNRLSPIRNNIERGDYSDINNNDLNKSSAGAELSDVSSSENSSSSHSDYSVGSENESHESNSENESHESNSENESHESHSENESSESDSENDDGENRRYPRRQRTQREIPGAIPWSAVNI